MALDRKRIGYLFVTIIAVLLLFTVVSFTDLIKEPEANNASGTIDTTESTKFNRELTADEIISMLGISENDFIYAKVPVDFTEEMDVTMAMEVYYKGDYEPKIVQQSSKRMKDGEVLAAIYRLQDIAEQNPDLIRIAVRTQSNKGASTAASTMEDILPKGSLSWSKSNDLVLNGPGEYIILQLAGLEGVGHMITGNLDSAIQTNDLTIIFRVTVKEFK